MKKNSHPDVILVCGYPAMTRLSNLLPKLDSQNLVLHGAHTQKDLLTKISRWQPPACIVEHEVSIDDPAGQLADIFTETMNDEWIANLTSRTQITFSPSTTALELLPELVSRSPQTLFVITSHYRGRGISVQERTLYKEFPEVVKTMGFINSAGNTDFLLKLLNRIYQAKKPRKTMPACATINRAAKGGDCKQSSIPVEIQEMPSPTRQTPRMDALIAEANIAGFEHLGWVTTKLAGVAISFTSCYATKTGEYVLTFLDPAGSEDFDAKLVNIQSRLDGGRLLSTGNLDLAFSSPERGAWRFAHPAATISELLEAHKCHIDDLGAIALRQFNSFEQVKRFMSETIQKVLV